MMFNEVTVPLNNVEVTEDQLREKLHELEQLKKENLVQPGTTAKIALIAGYRISLDRESLLKAAQECEVNVGLIPVLNPKTFTVDFMRRIDVINHRVTPIEISTR